MAVPIQLIKRTLGGALCLPERDSSECYRLGLDAAARSLSKLPPETVFESADVLEASEESRMAVLMGQDRKREFYFFDKSVVDHEMNSSKSYYAKMSIDGSWALKQHRSLASLSF